MIQVGQREPQEVERVTVFQEHVNEVLHGLSSNFGVEEAEDERGEFLLDFDQVEHLDSGLIVEGGIV